MRPTRSGCFERRSLARILVTLAAGVATACGGEGGSRADEPAAAADREGYLTGAAGARLHYRVLGSGSDTVVVVHGGPGAGLHTMLPHMRRLADDFVVILYDQRGGGRSELPADTSLLHARYHVEDLEAVRRHFGLERLKLITHSFGSVLVARYAQKYPERLDRIVFHGATGPERAEAARVARAASSHASPDSALSARATELLRALLSGTAIDPVATCEEYEEIGRRIAAARGDSVTWEGTTCAMPPEAVAYYYRHTAQHSPRTFGAWDFTRGLEDVAAPLLVVYGAGDTLALPSQRAWAAAVPNGRLLLVPGAGKSAFTDRPDRVFPAVTMFLKGEWPAGAEEVDR